MKQQYYVRSLTLVLLAASAAPAQTPPRGGINPAARPAFSPYLNLLRTDQDPSLNYFGLVRPQIDFRQSLEQAEAGLADQSQQLTNAANTPALPGTGHVSGFLTQSKYFMNSRRAGATGGQGGSVGNVPGGRAGVSSSAIGQRR